MASRARSTASGERWSLLVVRELMLGPKRFTDLRTGLPHVGPDVLSQRLRDLEQAGVLVSRKLPPPAASQVYELTDWGRELEPVLIALGRWGARAPAAPEGCGMSFDAHLLSLQHAVRPLAGARASRPRCELQLGDERFRAVVVGWELTLERGEVDQPDAVITSDHGTLLARRPPAASSTRSRPRATSRSRATATRSSASSGCSRCPSPWLDPGRAAVVGGLPVPPAGAGGPQAGDGGGGPRPAVGRGP